MAIVEQMELVRHRTEIDADVRGLIDKYLAIFEQDAPRNDQYVAENLIVMEVRRALVDIEKELLGE